MNKPLVSIIMPVYKTPLDHVKRAIGSITSQTYTNIELFVVIAGCDEDYCADIRLIGDGDERIVVHRIEHAGVSGARNYGTAKAHGEDIMFMDSDDEMLPQAVEQALDALVRYELDMAFGFIEYRMEKAVHMRHPRLESGCDVRIIEGAAIEKARDFFFSREVPKGASQMTSFDRGPVAEIMSIDLARSVPFDVAIAYTEDVVFNALVVAKTKRIGLVDDIWYIYYQNGYSAVNSLRLDEALIDHATALHKYCGINEDIDNDVYANICYYFFDALANEVRRKYKGCLRRVRWALKQPECVDAFEKVDISGFDMSPKHRINYWLCKKRWAFPVYLFFSLRAIGQRARGESPREDA